MATRLQDCECIESDRCKLLNDSFYEEYTIANSLPSLCDLQRTTLMRRLGNTMDSVSAFSHAARVLDSKIRQVSRLNGANSVWECTAEYGPFAVIKNYARDHHSEEHYFSETFLLEQNKGRGFLPSLMHVDESAFTAILAYEGSNPDSTVEFAAIVRAIQEFPSLTLPAHIHLDLPGICSSWANGGAHLGIAENLVLTVARQRSALSTCVERFSNDWAHETTIHGDLKLANVRLQAQTFKIIDWETVGMGSKYWDTAGLTQSILLEIIGKGSLENWARSQMVAVKELLCNADQAFNDALVTRLVQSALEAAQKSTLVPQFSASVLQLAEYLASENREILESL